MNMCGVCDSGVFLSMSACGSMNVFEFLVCVSSVCYGGVYLSVCLNVWCMLWWYVFACVYAVR